MRLCLRRLPQRFEKSQDTFREFFRLVTESGAVVCARNAPEFFWTSCCTEDHFTVAARQCMILFVANDQNGERTGSDGLNGGNVRRWEACELSTAVNHQPSAGSKEGFAEPGILAKARVVICRFLQIGEGSLRDQGFDTRIGAGACRAIPAPMDSPRAKRC